MKITTSQYAKALIQLTEEASGKELDMVMKEFVLHLASRHELSRWREIRQAFTHAWRHKYGAADVKLETAVVASAELLASVQARYPAATITQTVKPELIGGAIVQIDDRRLDGSIVGQLNRLQQNLYGN